MVMMGEKTKSFCLLKVVDTQGKGSRFYRRRLFELASDIVDSNEVQYLGAGWMNEANERGEGGFLTYEILQALSTSYLPRHSLADFHFAPSQPICAHAHAGSLN